jgi:hypothetical protein
MFSRLATLVLVGKLRRHGTSAFHTSKDINSPSSSQQQTTTTVAASGTECEEIRDAST